VIIIFGWRTVWRTVATGVFHCGHCGGDRNYRRRSGRRFFTLFFIPVIPLGLVGEHVQCTTCRTSYRTSALHAPTVARMQAAVTDGVRGMVAIMVHAGDINSVAARRRALQVVTGAGVAGYHEGALVQDLARPLAQWRPAIAAFGSQLQPEAREWHLAEMIRIALADGALTDTERGTAAGIGGDLGLTPAQVVGVIALTERASTAEPEP
jgi:hypothetical protein